MLYHMIRPFRLSAHRTRAAESRDTTPVTVIVSRRPLRRREIDGLNAKSPQRRAGEAHRKLLCRRVGPGRFGRSAAAWAGAYRACFSRVAFMDS